MLLRHYLHLLGRQIVTLQNSQNQSNRVYLKIEALQLTNFFNLFISIVKFVNSLLAYELFFYVLRLLWWNIKRVLFLRDIWHHRIRLAIIDDLKSRIWRWILSHIGSFLLGCLFYKIVFRVFFQYEHGWLGISMLLLPE